ncbi:MAG: tRNA (adenosine(37)-N6)-threonylcarbamoyltransferase complex dimerization subunit type 1 TsaB [Cellvibrionaceae bacterium]
MSVILALDSSTEACSVAISCNGEVIERYEVAPQGHSKLLLPMVDSVLAESGKTIGDVDGIAFGCGPGGFTGLRICAGTVQGLAFGADLPVLPVSSLEAMAQSALRLQVIDATAVCLPAFDARMSEVYWGIYRAQGDMVESVRADCVSAPQLLVDAIAEHEIVQGVGTGWGVASLDNIRHQAKEIEFFPQARDLLPRAAINLENNLGINACEVEPVYLRNEVSWEKRKRLRDR